MKVTTTSAVIIHYAKKPGVNHLFEAIEGLIEEFKHRMDSFEYDQILYDVRNGNKAIWEWKVMLQYIFRFGSST